MTLFSAWTSCSPMYNIIMVVASFVYQVNVEKYRRHFYLSLLLVYESITALHKYFSFSPLINSTDLLWDSENKCESPWVTCPLGLTCMGQCFVVSKQFFYWQLIYLTYTSIHFCFDLVLHTCPILWHNEIHRNSQ